MDFLLTQNATGKAMAARLFDDCLAAFQGPGGILEWVNGAAHGVERYVASGTSLYAAGRLLGYGHR